MVSVSTSISRSGASNRDRFIGRTILTSGNLTSSFGNERWERGFLEAAEKQEKEEGQQSWQEGKEARNVSLKASERSSRRRGRGMPGPPRACYSPQPGSTTRLAFFVVNNLA